MKHRVRHETCIADVLSEEDAKDLGGDAMELERYGIARTDDPLDEVDIGGSTDSSRPTFISQYLALE